MWSSMSCSRPELTLLSFSLSLSLKLFLSHFCTYDTLLRALEMLCRVSDRNNKRFLLLSLSFLVSCDFYGKEVVAKRCINSGRLMRLTPVFLEYTRLLKYPQTAKKGEWEGKARETAAELDVTCIRVIKSLKRKQTNVHFLSRMK